MRPAVKVAKIAGASRHSRLETEPNTQGDCRRFSQNHGEANVNRRYLTRQISTIFDRLLQRLKSLVKSLSQEQVHLAIFAGDQISQRRAYKIARCVAASMQFLWHASSDFKGIFCENF